MLLLFPLAAWALLFAWARVHEPDRRAAAMVATVWWGTCLAVITETLSSRNLVTRLGTTLAWVLASLLAFLAVAVRRKGARVSLASGAIADTVALERPLKLLLAACGILLSIVMVLAFVAAPSTWDAMEYHLPRTVFWMSNHNVRFFATPDYCQLIFGPWAEYAQLHANLLWGSDRFVNFVEFFAMLGSILAASLIARQLGAGRRGQALAAIAVATIPEGILEASGPMNTWVVTFWIASTVYFLLRSNDEPGWRNAVCVGLSAGIAVLTKGTAYVYLPFLVAACWMAGNREAKIRFLKFAPVFLALIVAVNAPQYFRAYEFTGSPLGLPFADGGPRLHWMADAFGPQDVAANVVRNASLHIVTPSSALNGKIDRVAKAVIRAIGRDPDDPKTTWPNSAFESNHFSLHEIHA
ncbi:MAG TPA: glycosyltransferase family 39 protein, partial [Candidatus Acidoferrum sp.]|nr:glycosyltransferase family 39 protein [Candidatus Acidoferrum sp.]